MGVTIIASGLSYPDCVWVSAGSPSKDEFLNSPSIRAETADTEVPPCFTGDNPSM
jgi:hypothetical protein